MITENLKIEEISKNNIDLFIKHLEALLKARQEDYVIFGEVYEDAERDNKIKQSIKQLKDLK